MEQATLRHIIQRKLANGTLPHDSIPRIWGGPGNGETCDACEETISKNEFVMEGIGEAKTSVQFHVACFYIWDKIRIVPGREETPP